ncbi:MAG: DUF481 domain-containing protein [Halothiobacillaceae bacterium]
MKRQFIAAAMLCLPLVGQGAEKGDSPWSGEFDLGVSAKTGNTESTNIQGKLDLHYDKALWRHRFRLGALRETESGEKTAQRVTGQFQSNYQLGERSYLFGVARAERDEFSGYDYQASLVAGFGYRLWMSEQGHLDLEAGPGFRRAKQDDLKAENEAVGRLRGDFKYKLGERSDFSQELTVIAGQENTETESITALTAGINDALALRLSLTVSHNTEVPQGTKKTDTFTTASVVYKF